MNSQTNQQITGMKLVFRLVLTLLLLVSTRAGAGTNYTLSVTVGHTSRPKAGEAMRNAILAHVEAMKKK